MKLLPKANLLKYGLSFLLILLAFLTFSTKATFAIQNKGQDTVSAGELNFTEIPTTAEKIANKKKQAAEIQKAKPVAVVKATEVEKPKSLWEVFIHGLLGGFLAIVMPCIYPLLPLTVSFFTKKNSSRSKAIAESVLYGLSIIIIYVSLGLLITLLFGPSALNALATNGIFNLFFFLLLVVFGISFLGAFEITLPSSLANKLDENSDKGGLAGIFFMAATLVVVSFSCTGPIIGDLLYVTATKGVSLGPAIGMLGFSVALALPFTFFSIFPSALKSLPKSGGWLNSVKVVLGLLELAFALKFLSNVDLAYHWNWFNRDIYLSLWIAIGLLMGLYLIGKIKFSHDSDLKHLSIPRTFFAIFVFAFVVYLIPGLWGAPLKPLSGLLPPLATQEFDLSQMPSAPASQGTKQVSIKVKKYNEHGNYDRIKTKGLDAWYDYEQALQVSKELHKPVFIDFTGFNCANCRNMEAEVWTDPKVFAHLRDDFVLLQLVVDDKAELDIKEQFVSKLTDRKITTIGGKWSEFEANRFGSNSQPYYVILDSDGNLLTDKNGKTINPMPANFVIPSYLKFLEDGIAAFHSKL